MKTIIHHFSHYKNIFLKSLKKISLILWLTLRKVKSIKWTVFSFRLRFFPEHPWIDVTYKKTLWFLESLISDKRWICSRRNCKNRLYRVFEECIKPSFNKFLLVWWQTFPWSGETASVFIKESSSWLGLEWMLVTTESKTMNKSRASSETFCTDLILEVCENKSITFNVSELTGRKEKN